MSDVSRQDAKPGNVQGPSDSPGLRPTPATVQLNSGAPIADFGAHEPDLEAPTAHSGGRLGALIPDKSFVRIRGSDSAQIGLPASGNVAPVAATAQFLQ